MADELLRYDGLYCYLVDKQHDYLRFYPDGLVLTSSSNGSAQQVARWLNKKYANSKQTFPSKGRYQRHQNNISFTACSLYSQTDYQGRIGFNQLELELVDRYTQRRFNAQYQFVACDFELLEQQWAAEQRSKPIPQFKGSKYDFKKITYSGFGLIGLCEPEFNFSAQQEKLIAFAHLGLIREFYEVIDDRCLRVCYHGEDAEPMVTIEQLNDNAAAAIIDAWQRPFYDNLIGRLYYDDVRLLSGAAKRVNIFVPDYRGRTKFFPLITDRDGIDGISETKKVVGLERGLARLTANFEQFQQRDLLKNALTTAQQYKFLFVII